MNSLPTRPKEGKKINPKGPKVRELTIGGGVGSLSFAFDAICLDFRVKIL